jgi:SnoaL-like domain
MIGQSNYRSERTMPTRERVQALIDLVEGGRYVEAIESFYYEDASMQENLDPPRHGRATLIRGERRVIEAHRSIRARPVQTFMVEGDRAVINWVFDFVDHEGAPTRSTSLPFNSGAASGSSRSASTMIRRSGREEPRRDEPPRLAVAVLARHPLRAGARSS